MLRDIKDLEEYAIGATDGHIGMVKDLLFDDDRWVIRYLVVETGSWLSSRRVLISPMSIHDSSWLARILPVSITKEQVRNSPDIDTDRPVSRQHELETLGFYGYPNYWGSYGMWGEGMYPYGMVPGYAGFGADDYNEGKEEAEAYAAAERARHRNDDPHLRSCNSVIGHHVDATDGEIGHVAEILVDERTWAVRYLVVDTSNWWLGHKVLIAPQWITGVHWSDRSVSVDLSRDMVKAAPAYESIDALNRQRELGLYEHYGRTGYWTSGVLEDIPA